VKYRLLGGRGSGSASVEFALAALGVEHEVIEAAPWDEHAPGLVELHAVNPLAQVPTLVTPAGEVLTESVAILWTLMERHPSDWMPAPSTTERAACLRWMMFVAANVYAAGSVVDVPSRWLADEGAREALQTGARARIARYWTIVADAWRGTPFLLGARPRIADVYVANISRWWGARQFLEENRPEFHALLRRIEALPEVAPVWHRHGFQ
jgi:GST-like protein